MYSLVLMATMATPATVPDCHRHRCSGWGRGCHGSCYGGCNGGCYGGASYGGCHGSYGCSGHGSAYYYSGSCYGGHSCYGCTGHYGCAGGGYVGGSYYAPGTVQGGAAAAPAPGGAMPAPAPAPAPGGAATPPRNQGYNSNGPAHIYVSLPADAKLYVDGQLTKTADKANRSFLTPDLDAGIEYRYVMKAEVVRDGQTQSETKTVIVRAGAQVQEEFGSLNSIITASR